MGDEIGGIGSREETDTLTSAPPGLAVWSRTHTAACTLTHTFSQTCFCHFVGEKQAAKTHSCWVFLCFRVEVNLGLYRRLNCLAAAAAATAAASERAASSAPLELAAPSDIITDTSPALCMDAHAKLLQRVSSMTQCKAASQNGRVKGERTTLGSKRQLIR